MCIGVPMRVMSGADEGLSALCVTRDGTARAIDLSLVGPQRNGTWLLTHQGAAREVIDATTAAQVADALEAVALAMAGGPVSAGAIDALFPDLAGREPELPPHLRAASAASKLDHGDI